MGHYNTKGESRTGEMVERFLESEKTKEYDT